MCFLVHNNLKNYTIQKIEVTGTSNFESSEILYKLQSQTNQKIDNLKITQDIKAIYNLIVELAVYEKEGDSVFLTVENLQQDYNRNPKPFDFYVAEKNGEIVGMALYYERYQTRIKENITKLC